MSEDSEDITFEVVKNHEEQFSIWPEHKAIPAGWHPVGKRGNKDECLRYIEEVWLDLRPLSLRQHLASLSDTNFNV